MNKKGMKNTLFGDINSDREDEWDGMPEFKQNPVVPILTIKLSFVNQKDIDEFSKLINQKVRHNCENYWFPKLNLNSHTQEIYIDEP